jgi:hypothetical protein
MPYGGIIVEPTRDHSQVLKALPTISGQASQQTTESAKSCRTRDTLNALADHLTGLAYLEGPKTIVFISSGMLLPRRDAPLTSAPGPCEIKTSDYDQVGRATAAARGQFYVIKPDDLVIDSIRRGLVVERGVLRPEPLDPSLSRFKSSDDEQAGLESLAGVTQGTLLRLTPADRTAFARIMRESAGYYLVGFEPRESERNGSYRRVEFDVARAGVKVRSRPNVLIDKGEGKRLALTPHAMLRDGKSYRDLPLRAVALGSPNPGDTKMTIVALVESLDSTATLESAAFGLIDQRGRLVAQWTATARELASRPLMSAGLVAPGRYRLRAAAIDATGRRGAADYEFSAAAVSASGMTMSAMVLGVGFPRSFVPKLQFYGEPTAAGQFEIFGAPETGTLSVAMELATTEDGPALIRVPGVVVVTRDADRRRAIGVIPVGTFGAGDYVMRGVVSLDGRPIGHVSRVLRKAAG